MNSEILAGLEYFERDKGIKREVLLEAINNAVLQAARKAVGPAKDLRVELDSKTGEMKAYAKLTVVEKVAMDGDVGVVAGRETVQPSTDMTTGPVLAGALSTFSLTSRPTISKR